MIELAHLGAMEVDEQLADRLMELTLPKGEMAPVFRTCRSPLRTDWVGRVVTASIDGQIVGWALRWRCFADNPWTVHVFVDPAHRRAGVGRALVRGARHRLRATTVIRGIPWDPVSEAFWAAMPVAA